MEPFIINDKNSNKIHKMIKIFMITTFSTNFIIIAILLLQLISLNFVFSKISSDISAFNKTIYIENGSEIKNDLIKLVEFACDVTNVCK